MICFLGKNTMSRLLALLAFCFTISQAGAIKTFGTPVDLEIQNNNNTVSVGDSFEVQLIARSAEPTQIISIGVALSWDASRVQLIEIVDGGQPRWFMDALPDDSGLDGLNNTFSDGNAFYQMLYLYPMAFGFVPIATPDGLHITTWKFRALAPGGAVIEPVESIGQYTYSKVGGADTPGQEVTGTLHSATIVIDSGGVVVGDRITDADGDPEGFAIVSIDNTNGIWQYSTNGGGLWTNIGVVAENNALLLRDASTDLIRFQPNLGWNGTVATGITFRAWDQTSGAAGTYVDTTTNGGATAFSTATETAFLIVLAANDAPVLDNTGDMSLSSINEDDSDSSGNSVEDIVTSDN